MDPRCHREIILYTYPTGIEVNESYLGEQGGLEKRERPVGYRPREYAQSSLYTCTKVALCYSVN